MERIYGVEIDFETGEDNLRELALSELDYIQYSGFSEETELRL